MPDRIEDCPNLNADVISARALAPLKKLLVFFTLHSNKNCRGLFLKGKNVKAEMDSLGKVDGFQLLVKPSLVCSESFVVEVKKGGN